MKAVLVFITAVLIAACGCGKISPVEAQPSPQFTGTYAFGNGPLVGAMTATNGNLTGTMVFAGSCLAQITGTYQVTGQTAFGQLTGTPLTVTPPATTTCPGTPVELSFFVAVSSSKSYFNFSVAGTNNQFSEEGFQ